MQTTRIKSIKKLGVQNTLDFEMASDNHNFVADGIVVSNSHSASYGYVSIITAYLKHKYTKEFFLSLLDMAKYEGNMQEIVSAASKEVAHYGIKLLPPNITKSFDDFSIEPEGIRFGLSSIKGLKNIELKTINAIREQAKADGGHKYAIFKAASDNKVNIGNLSALIQVGALGEDRRCRLVLEAQAFNILTEREQRNFTLLGPSCNYDILQSIQDAVKDKILGDDSKILMSEKRFETFKKKYEKYKDIFQKNVKHERFANWYFEKKLLGYSATGNLRDCCTDSENLSTIAEIKEMPDDSRVKAALQVKECFWKKTKKGGDFFKAETEDDTGDMNVMLFEQKRNDTFQVFKDTIGKKIEEESIIIVEGTKKSGDAIFANRIELVDEKVYLKLSELKD